MQRMSRSCRSCGTSIKRFFRRKCKRGKTAALTDEERAQEDKDQRSKWADKVQADGWAREAAYSKQLHNAMRNAKRKRNIDLYAYFDQVYNNAKPGSSIYIGVHELCHVVERNPCPPSQHLQCMARKVLDAYNQVKVRWRWMCCRSFVLLLSSRVLIVLFVFACVLAARDHRGPSRAPHPAGVSHRVA